MYRPDTSVSVVYMRAIEVSQSSSCHVLVEARPGSKEALSRSTEAGATSAGLKVGGHTLMSMKALPKVEVGSSIMISICVIYCQGCCWGISTGNS